MAVRTDMVVRARFDGAQAQRGMRGMSRSLKSMAGLIGGTFAVRSLIRFGTESVKLSQIQETAERQLQGTLEYTGQLTEANRKMLFDFAAQLQKLGLVGDEATLKMQNMGLRMGLNVGQTNEAIQAALDLSAATGIELNSAFTNLARTMSGQAGLLGRMGIDVSSLTKEQLKQGAAIKLVAEQFGGSAQALDESQKKVTRLSSAWGDFKEKIGNALTGSQGGNALVDKLIELVESAVSNFDDLKAMFNKLVTPFRVAFEGVEKISQVMGTLVGEIDNLINRRTDFITSLTEIGKAAGLEVSIPQPTGPETDQILLPTGEWVTLADFKSRYDKAAQEAAKSLRLPVTLGAPGAAPTAPTGPTEADTIGTGVTTEVLAAEAQIQAKRLELAGKTNEAFAIRANERLTQLKENGVSAVAIEQERQNLITESAREAFQAQVDLDNERERLENERRERSKAAKDQDHQENMQQLTSFGEGIVAGFEGMQSASDMMAQFGEAATRIFTSDLANSITSVFAALGAGEKISFKALAGSLLQALGAAAINLGMFAILAATVALFAGPALEKALGIKSAKGLLAAGIALVAFGAAATAAGAAMQKGGAKTGAGAGVGAPGGPGGPGGAPIGTREQATQINLTVQALNPAAVDWDDLSENQIGPALERVVNRGASRMQVATA